MNYISGFICFLIVLLATSSLHVNAQEQIKRPQEVQQSVWPGARAYPLSEKVNIQFSGLKKGDHQFNDMALMINGQEVLTRAKDTEGIGFMGMGGSSSWGSSILIDCSYETAAHYPDIVKQVMRDITQSDMDYFQVFLLTHHGLYPAVDMDLNLSPGIITNKQSNQIRIRHYLERVDVTRHFKREADIEGVIKRLVKNDVQRLFVYTRAGRIDDPEGVFQMALREKVDAVRPGRGVPKRIGKDFRVHWNVYGASHVPLDTKDALGFVHEVRHFMGKPEKFTHGQAVSINQQRHHLQQFLYQRQLLNGSFEDLNNQRNAEPVDPWHTAYVLRVLNDEGSTFMSDKNWRKSLQWLSGQPMRQMRSIQMRFSLTKPYSDWLSQYHGTDYQMLLHLYNARTEFQVRGFNMMPVVELPKVKVPEEQMMYIQKMIEAYYRDAETNRLSYKAWVDGLPDTDARKFGLMLIALTQQRDAGANDILAWLQENPLKELPDDPWARELILYGMSVSGYYGNGKQGHGALFMKQINKELANNWYEKQSNASTVEGAVALRWLQQSTKRVQAGMFVSAENIFGRLSMSRKISSYYGLQQIMMLIPIETLAEVENLPPVLVLHVDDLIDMTKQNETYLKSKIEKRETLLFVVGDLDETQTKRLQQISDTELVTDFIQEEPLIGYVKSDSEIIRFYHKDGHVRMIHVYENFDLNGAYEIMRDFEPKTMPKLRELIAQ